MAAGGLVRWVSFALVVLACSRGAYALEPAAPKEIREFEVLLKGRPVGTTTFVIEPLTDGRTAVTIEAAVRVNMIVYSYSYEFHGVETWLGGQLESFQCQGNDGGKKFAVQGKNTANGSQLVVNNRPNAVQPFAAAGNFWRLPQLPNGGALVNIDASTGKLQQIKIAEGKPEQVPLGQTQIPARHFLLSGDVDQHLWLDQHGLLVRQTSIEQGYPTELRLTGIRRVANAPTGRPVLGADGRAAAPTIPGAR